MHAVSCWLSSGARCAGVLLWEILTYGEYPYADCATAESVALQVTTLGARLPRPEACSTELGTLMEKCECEGDG